MNLPSSIKPGDMFTDGKIIVRIDSIEQVGRTPMFHCSRFNAHTKQLIDMRSVGKKQLHEALSRHNIKPITQGEIQS